MVSGTFTITRSTSGGSLGMEKNMASCTDERRENSYA